VRLWRTLRLPEGSKFVSLFPCTRCGTNSTFRTIIHSMREAVPVHRVFECPKCHQIDWDPPAERAKRTGFGTSDKSSHEV